MKMMKKIIFIVTLLLFLQVNAFTQTESVKVEFNINGIKFTKNQFDLWIYSENEVIEIKGRKGRFIVPEGIKTIENMDMRLKIGKYDLSFSELTPKYFDNKWIVGIDNTPFISKEVPIKNGKKPKLLYNIEFYPDNAEAVGQAVAIY